MLVTNVLILDCDVHQGNGTAAIFQGDESVFTFSIHGASNYPYHKEKSDLDIATKRHPRCPYLEALSNGLIQLNLTLTRAVIFLAGADPFKSDRFGKLGLSKEGLKERDTIVFRWCRQLGLPVAVTMAGGYAEEIDDIVDIHCETVKEAKRQFQ